MDIVSVLETNIVSVVMGFLCIILFLKNRGKQNLHSRLPPGPSPLPIVGNLFQMDVKQPYKFYLEISKKYGSVFTVWLGSKPVVVLSGYETIKDALVSQGEEFSGRANYPVLMKVTRGYGLLASSGSSWRDLRRFSITTLKNFGMGQRSLAERIQDEAKNLVEAFRKHGDSAFNPKQLLCNAVSNIIYSIVFGQRLDYDDKQFKFLLSVINNYFNFLSSSKGQLYNMFPWVCQHLPGPHHQVFEGFRKLQKYVEKEADRRLEDLDRESPRDYIEAFLVRMEEEKGQPHSSFVYENLVASVWSLFSAGTETTSSTLRHSLLLMQKYPHVQERIQREIDEVIGSSRCPSVQDRQNMPYTDAIIHEIQRTIDLAPTSLPHKMMRDTEFKGYCIPKDTMVLPLLSSVLSDPKLWKNPHTFDPGNFLAEDGSFKKADAFLPFGLGKRVCPGEGLARMELFLFFTSLLQRFTFSSTQPLEEIDISPECSSFGKVPRSYHCYATLRS
ncbi:cytochrome P450 2M1-like [Amia ocellicauda]|uniref:cytochrome P450 2M1-like n=1 Tax=Amia ocellicauda TaxID=2972642 RepID=UPI003463F753